MIPYDIDPSLYTAEPETELLGDGFSPPHHGEPAPPEETQPEAQLEQLPSGKGPL